MDKQNHLHTNHLIHESSPYLLQHAHNPVNWYPWGEEALEKAKRENKLILISIGYSACHWCHVMEHESFENEEIAAYMNENYVAIKVDREERPDIDQVYMNAVQLLSGRGGWPLNCIALPDGRPIYGGTYFPPEQWLDMLKQVDQFVKSHPAETEEQAQKLTQGIQSQESIYLSEEASSYSLEDLEGLFSHWKGHLDYRNGGSTGAPKFPLPSGYNYLLFHHYLTSNSEAMDAVSITLEKMANGGIYDQIGGGFARYSTDDTWKVPHFEKMLYDNAQLVSLYAKAYQMSNKPLYKEVVDETLDFIQREMTSGEGGFYSALDADSEGVEGKFYVWKADEIKAILGESYALFADYYNIKENGNWEEGNNILFTSGNTDNLLKKYSFSDAELKKRLKKASKTLLQERDKRVHPGRDEKILTSWNALMISGYIDAYKAFEDKRYLDRALKNATFLMKNMLMEDSRLLRNYKDGKASINGFLDDYAFTISAFTALYQATFDEKWLSKAKDLCEYTLLHFFDNKSGMFYYTSDVDPDLIARKMEVTDNVIPAAGSEMAKNLFILGKYYYHEDYLSKAKQMLDNVKEHTMTGASYYSNWDVLMAWFATDLYEVAILGPEADKVRQELNTHYLPDVILMGGGNEASLSLMENKLVPGQTTIYVCKDRTCQLPTIETAEALKQISAHRMGN